MTLTIDQITAYITEQFGPPDAPPQQINRAGTAAKYRFEQDGAGCLLTIGIPDALNPHDAHLARAELTWLAGEHNLTGRVIWIDPDPEGLPEGVVAYAREYVSGVKMRREDYLADPLRLARMLRSLHSLGANRPFDALSLPDIEHPQLRNIHPLTPLSALAWYLPDYAGEYPSAGTVAQQLATLWLHLDQAYAGQTFEFNMPVITHNDLGWHNSIVTPEGHWRLVDFEAASIDDPIVDFVWPLSALDEAGQRAFLSEYGIPDYVHDDWLAHWRLRYVYRNLSAATYYAYAAFAGLAGREVAGFAAAVQPFDDCHDNYYSFIASAASELGFDAPPAEAWT